MGSPTGGKMGEWDKPHLRRRLDGVARGFKANVCTFMHLMIGWRLQVRCTARTLDLSPSTWTRDFWFSIEEPMDLFFSVHVSSGTMLSILWHIHTHTLTHLVNRVRIIRWDLCLIEDVCRLMGAFWFHARDGFAWWSVWATSDADDWYLCYLLQTQEVVNTHWFRHLHKQKHPLKYRLAVCDTSTFVNPYTHPQECSHSAIAQWRHPSLLERLWSLGKRGHLTGRQMALDWFFFLT